MMSLTRSELICIGFAALLSKYVGVLFYITLKYSLNSDNWWLDTDFYVAMFLPVVVAHAAIVARPNSRFVGMLQWVRLLSALRLFELAVEDIAGTGQWSIYQGLGSPNGYMMNLVFELAPPLLIIVISLIVASRLVASRADA